MSSKATTFTIFRLGTKSTNFTKIAIFRNFRKIRGGLFSVWEFSQFSLILWKSSIPDISQGRTFKSHVLFYSSLVMSLGRL